MYYYSEDFEAVCAYMVLDYNTPLTDNISANNFIPLANSISVYHSSNGDVEQEGGQLMF